MNKTFLFNILVCLSVEIFGIGNSSIDIISRIGYTNFAYQLIDGKRKGALGYGFDMEYVYIFKKNIGFSIGVDMYKYASKIQHTYSEISPNIYDTDEELCDITSYFNKNTQYAVFFISLPVSFQIQIPIKSNFYILLANGAKYSLSVANKENIRWQTHKIGYYDQWHLTIDDVHEFGEIKQSSVSRKIPSNNTITVFSKIDFGIALSPQWSLLIGLDAQYQILNSLYIQDYSKGKIHPFCLNLEIGCRCILKKHKSKYPCRCVTS